MSLSGSLGLARDDPQLHFAQLKGMADALSLGLSFGGFNVSKYLPYGPMADVMPYLIRRAEENRGLLGNTGPERKTIRWELGRQCAVIWCRISLFPEIGRGRIGWDAWQ